MLEFGQDISFVALVIIEMISELHDFRITSTRETHAATCPSPIAQVLGAPFFLHN